MAAHIDGFYGRSVAVLAVTCTMLALSTLFVVLRVVSKAGIVRKVSIDDWIMLFAWILALGMSVSLCFAASYGLGRHEMDVPDQWQPALRRSDYVFSVLYNPALMAQKTSILAFYLALPTGNKIFKWFSIATLFVVNAGGFALTMLNAFQCNPPRAAFVTDTANAHCVDIVTVYLSSAPLNIITDLAILFLPMPVLTGMRLPKKQKIILVITFGFGIFVAAVDVVRIAYLQDAAAMRLQEVQSNQGTTGGLNNNDFTWYASFSFMWSVIEVNVGVMCACVPSLKPLASRFLPRMLKDAGDADSKFSSLSFQGAANMPSAQRIPSVPDTMYNQDPARDSGPPNPDDEGPMGMMDFLTTPDMNEPQTGRLQRSQTALTNTSRHTPALSGNFFDFVDMNKKKSMVQMTNRECVFPIAMVTVLFFVWGFSYGLLDVLNQQFQNVAHMSSGQGTAIHSAYYAGYFVGPLVCGRLVLKHWGFKACYMVGLTVYACGTLIYWPAAVLTSFPGYFITNFVVGFGLSILENAANPFMALCGPQAYAEIRLNLSQGVQAIGTVIAPLIANRAFLHKSQNAPSLISTQWAYLGISLATVCLAVLYYYVPLPEATDDELEDASERIDHANKAKLGGVCIIWITLGFAVFSQFCYVGAQEVNGTIFDSWLGVVSPRASPSNFFAVAHTAFAVSRFLAAGLGFWVQPRMVLLICYVGAIVFEVLAMNFRGGTGIAMLIMVFFFEGPIFALVYAQALRGMGRQTKLSASLITAAIGGGAVFSPISNVLMSSRGPMYALVVAVASFAGGTLFPVYLNLVPKAKRQCDPIKDNTDPGAGSRPSSTSSRKVRALSFLHIGGKKNSSEQTAVEHREVAAEKEYGGTP